MVSWLAPFLNLVLTKFVEGLGLSNGRKTILRPAASALSEMCLQSRFLSVCFLRALPTFVFALMAFSGDSHKRVLDAKSGNLLPRIQIFREEPCRAALDCGGDDEGIPEADLRFVFNAECHRKLGWSGFHAPDGVTADHQSGRPPLQVPAHLASAV